LTATGDDANGDSLTYTWEELDLGAASNSAATMSTDDGTRPLFRVFSPTTDPSRTFPQLSDIRNNTSTLGETLPTTTRTMTFRVSARDNRAGAGGIATDEMQLFVTNTGAPFVVTAPNTAVSWSGGSTQAINWNVAGTAGAPINTANVKISLSTDGGLTFPTVLLASTPNDGSQTVCIPNTPATQARVKIEGVNNVFFDMSNTNFTITSGSACGGGGTPNLIVNALSVPGGAAATATGAGTGYVAPGGTIDVTDTNKNNGTGAADPSATKLYYSQNNTWDAGDTLLTPTAGRSVGSIAPNGTDSGTTTVTIPGTPTVGKRFIIAKADAGTAVGESNENDNTKPVTVYIGPDLLISGAVTLSANTVPRNGNVTVYFKVKNHGAVNAAATIARLYYSNNSTFEAGSDTLLAHPTTGDTDVAVGALNAGQIGSTISTLVKIPGTATVGSARYIFVVVDPLTNLPEAKDTNNKKSRKFAVS
jgi:hypothetical protein